MAGALAVAALCAVVVPCALLLLSLGAVEQNEYGLVYNWITKTITNKVYHGGTHFIGFWNSFVVFPATVQTVEFSDRVGMRTAEALHTRTKEGLGLHLSISFQYKLNPDQIPKLYALTNVQYEGLFTRIARDQLLEAASEYEGPQYWLARHDIGDHMRRLVDTKMKESYASLWGLQLLIIDLPDRYENSITITQVQNQIIQTRRNQQMAASIRADTEVMKSKVDRDIDVVRAGAGANYTKVTKMAEAEAAERKINAEAGVLGYVRRKLHLSAFDTVKYQELAAYSSLTNATFLANMGGVMPTMQMVSVNTPAPAPPATLLQKGRAGKKDSTGGQATLSAGSLGDQSPAFAEEEAGGERDDSLTKLIALG